VSGAALLVFSLVTPCPRADADPALRVQVDQRGDFTLFGNVSGQDCDPSVPLPVVGTVGACGINTADTAIDVFWRADDTSAVANTSITAAEARSTAVLQLPPGATITYARLYWGAVLTSSTLPTAGPSVTLERPGIFSTTINNDSSWVVAKLAGENDVWFYQSSADITATVQSLGTGAYRVGGIASMDILNIWSPDPYVAWSVVVFYKLDSDPPRNLALFDGLNEVGPGSNASVTLRGFLVPQVGYDAKLGVIAYEGDDRIEGDSLLFNGTVLSDAENPANNFFNGTRSYLGQPVSVVGDLPQLTGTHGSLSGLDLDVVDVTSLVHPGDTSATIMATSSGDVYLLGAFITSIATWKPDLGTSTKTVTDVNGGSVRPGDILRYQITVTNTGNDTATNILLTDALPSAVTLVPGSIQILSGPNAGPKSDAPGDDQAEINPTTGILTARLGTGANATAGGTLEPGASTILQFSVQINAGATGTLRNLARINAAGLRGAPAADYLTNGGQPTETLIDLCQTNADCAAPTPFCDLAVHPNICVQCLDNSGCSGTTPMCDLATNTCRPCTGDGAPSCTDPSRPDCQTSGPLAGSCTQCSATNTTLCVGATPYCATALGICVGCLDDSNCSGTTPFCSPLTHACSACQTDGPPSCPDPSRPACQQSGPLAGACTQCSGTNTTRCMGSTPVCFTDEGICVACVDNSTCPSTAPLCNPATHTCTHCTGDGPPSCMDVLAPACQTSGPLAGSCTECSATNTSRCSGTRPVCLVGEGVCVQCLDNSTCAGPTPFCNLATHTCVPCSGDGAPSCTDPNRPACQTSGPLSGSCTQCSATNTTLCTGATPVCLLSDGVCVQCVSNAQCGGATPICNPTTHTCVPCTSDASCPDPSHPACQSSGPFQGYCTECSATNRTRCSGATPFCDVTGVCVGCTNNSDCSGTTPVCDYSTHTCVGCNAMGSGKTGLTGGCPDPSRPICELSGPLAGACTECSATDTTHCTADRPYCLLSNGTCVACRDDGDCTGPNSWCNPATHTCAPCRSNADCTDPRRPVCQLTGPLAGACTECSATDSHLCTGNRPICLTNLGLCGCTDTDGDSECGSSTSGMICNGPAGICVPGCSTAPGRNGCPAGQYCSDQTGGVGTCTNEPCNVDADCQTAPLLHCETDKEPHACVQCVVNADCPTGTICTDDHVCWECAPSKAGNGCSPMLGGTLCLPNGTCGCQSDSDCGDPASGMICDPTTGRCTMGCRGEGGNGCPIGEACSSMSTDPGQCGAPAPDGGSKVVDAGTPPADAGAQNWACELVLCQNGNAWCTPMCDSHNMCMQDSCDLDTHQCQHTPKPNGTTCGISGYACRNGSCKPITSTCSTSEGSGLAGALLLLLGFSLVIRRRPVKD
jgi:uncharacterized repeat protein (TIGR01451 family)/MYXO-CTERM domain-containing protein